ncbi:MAG: ATP-dependent DNA ligase [Nocardioidaceae bacterium]
MLLSDVVVVSQQVASTRSRLAKRDAIAELLRRGDPADLEIVVPYLSGELRQRKTGLGWAALQSLPEPADTPSLTLVEVDAAFARSAALAGVGSAAGRAAAVAALFGRATASEQRFLRGLISGDVRQGALDAAMLDAIAAASGVSLGSIRRAAMLRGSTAPVALAALTVGAAAVAEFGLVVGQPVRPMLASSAPSVGAAFDKIGAAEVSLDVKLDGIRIQVHRHGAGVRVFTRSLEEITDRLPEVVAVARAFAASEVILDGEALSLDETGRPRAFQETAARTARHLAGVTDPSGPTVTPFFFDCLHVDGVDLLDLPLSERLTHLDVIVPSTFLVPRLVTSDSDAGQRFFDEAVASGQEGVVVKSLTAPYDAGRRGAAWVKVKPRQTLDLVVLAVEWGSGRRRGTLSNIHLGARDPANGGFVMLGKTFKGMTDEILAWQTERFLALETSRTAYVVEVRPVQVVEIAFDGLQRSTRYPAGVALRFARVLRYRDDKTADEADTIDTVRELTT